MSHSTGTSMQGI